MGLTLSFDVDMVVGNWPSASGLVDVVRCLQAVAPELQNSKTCKGPQVRGIL